MIRTSLVALALSVALASSTQAMPTAPIQQPDPIVTTVRAGCGVGFQRIRGVCVRNTTTRQVRRAVRRCAAGLRLVDGRCIR